MIFSTCPEDLGDQGRSFHIATPVKWNPRDTWRKFYQTLQSRAKRQEMSRSSTNARTPSSRRRKRGQCLQPKLALTVISLNVEGLSASCCKTLQRISLWYPLSTRNPPWTITPRPHVEGMTTLTERPHEKYGSIILAKNGRIAESTSNSDMNNIKVLTWAPRSYRHLSLQATSLSIKDAWDNINRKTVIRDFNSHFTQWGYADNNADWDTVETSKVLQQWTLESRLQPWYCICLPYHCWTVQKAGFGATSKDPTSSSWHHSPCSYHSSHSPILKKIQLRESKLDCLCRISGKEDSPSPCRPPKLWQIHQARAPSSLQEHPKSLPHPIHSGS